VVDVSPSLPTTPPDLLVSSPLAVEHQVVLQLASESLDEDQAPGAVENVAANGLPLIQI
jgi:hypothetical protein